MNNYNHFIQLIIVYRFKLKIEKRKKSKECI